MTAYQTLVQSPRIEQQGDTVDARAICLSNSSHLPAIEPSILVKPVVWPPGRGRARNKAAADRIGDGSENDGDRARLLQQRLGGGCG